MTEQSDHANAPHWRFLFLQALRETGNVSAAARAAGKSPPVLPALGWMMTPRHTISLIFGPACACGGDYGVIWCARRL
ncbi:MAG: hypothetical protein EBR92_10735, partial [Alphaproteobacteria bacterium]|nr:hypothetical protein [Alphaproteobacteria bacterium]